MIGNMDKDYYNLCDREENRKKEYKHKHQYNDSQWKFLEQVFISYTRRDLYNPDVKKTIRSSVKFESKKRKREFFYIFVLS